MKADEVLSEITFHYLESKDFNGCTLRHVREFTGLPEEETRQILVSLVQQGHVSVISNRMQVNPHIRMSADIPEDVQLENLESDSKQSICLYPSKNYLDEVVDRAKYVLEPYTLLLALGYGQLEFRVFDLSVLEIYRNDPRFTYENDDIRGYIWLSDRYYQSIDVQEHDRILLETFGFAFDEDKNRAVAVFIRYLRNLSAEHQQLWKGKELHGSYKLHPDYYRNSILGEWGEGISIFIAFIEELRIINEMCKTMGRSHLFYSDFKDSRPRNFGFLLRPTLNEYNSFVLVLDKMMSDNLNKVFFKGEISDTTEIERSEGKISVQQRGTISMLCEWLEKRFVTDDPEPMKLIRDGFKAVRRKRQKPAHSITPDEYSQKFLHEQQHLMKQAYNSIRTIRLIFANHPLVRMSPPKISDPLFTGKIWDF